MFYYTADNREILDGIAGLWCCNAGHNRKPIVEAIQKQAATMDYPPAFQMGQPLAFGNAPASLAGSNCFASSTAADLVHADGSKRIGSAQLWRGGRLLQHGSIQLEVDRQLWGEVFRGPAPALAPLPAMVIRRTAFVAAFFAPGQAPLDPRRTGWLLGQFLVQMGGATRLAENLLDLPLPPQAT